MTKEETQLLIKDLCARLPYRVKGLHRGQVHIIANMDGGSLYPSIQVNGYDAWFPIETFKPYLRPMESMTEKETYIFQQDILNEVEARCIHSLGSGKYSLAFTEANDWLNEHHFDYRGLIEKGLALEAPEDMYKTE